MEVGEDRKRGLSSSVGRWGRNYVHSFSDPALKLLHMVRPPWDPGL
jgi:hypothetical protein